MGRITKYFVVLLLIAVGCRVQKSTVLPGQQTPDRPELCSAPPFLQGNDCSITFRSGSTELTTNGDFYLDRDSIVFFRATILLELARGIITRDSFVILNRLEREFINEPISGLQKITPIPVSPALVSYLLSASPCLEALFSGSGARTEAMGDTVRKMFLKGGEEVVLTSEGTLLRSLVYSIPGQQAYLSAQYSDYVATRNGRSMPTSINIMARSQSGREVNVVFKIGQWIEGIKKPINFVLPSGYTKKVF